MVLKKYIVVFALCSFFMLAVSSCKKDVPEPEEEVVEQPVGSSDETLNYLKSAFEQKRDQTFLALKGKALTRSEIIPPYSTSSLAPFARDYSYSVINYAFKCFWLNENISAANQAFIENTEYYLNGPQNYLDDRDSFYWSVDLWCRMLEYWGSKGSIKAGVISKEAEEKAYQLMWRYVQLYSTLSYAEYSSGNTWDVDGSENHHAMQFFTFWHFTKFLKEDALYKDRTDTKDGAKVAEHFAAFNLYIKHWIVERAKKGLFVEMANEDYNTETLKGVYNCYDFGDAGMQKLSGNLLDLYWATWAEEQIAGVRGGAKARIYPLNSGIGNGPFWKLAYFYSGNSATSTQSFGNLYTFLTGKYRLPLVVMDIALSTSSRGNYEIRQRAPGLAKDGLWYAPAYRLKQDDGGIVRYSYCTPDFILGTAHFGARKYKEWTMISSQNRWQGLILNGSVNARIYPQCGTTTADPRAAYNQHWSVQSKGCLITQKLPGDNTGNNFGYKTTQMGVFFSSEVKPYIVEKEGWAFVTYYGTYVAVKPAAGGYTWSGDIFYYNRPVKWMILNDDTSPVIMEVAQKKNFASFAEFQNKVLALSTSYDGKVLKHRTLYNDDLTFYADRTSLPKVNNQTINLLPSQVYDSPFIQSTFNSGSVEIKFGTRKLNLSFEVH